MDFWKVGLLSLLCAASAFAIGAVELGRHQPTERISGGVSSKFDFFFFNLFHQILSEFDVSHVLLIGLVWFSSVDFLGLRFQSW